MAGRAEELVDRSAWSGMAGRAEELVDRSGVENRLLAEVIEESSNRRHQYS